MAIPKWPPKFGKRGNIIVKGDPGLDDLATQDFSFTPGSPATKIGFEPIPFNKSALSRTSFASGSIGRLYAGNCSRFRGVPQFGCGAHAADAPAARPQMRHPLYTGRDRAERRVAGFTPSL